MSGTHETMHGEHRLWKGEIHSWRDDLRVWQQELAKAQGEIEQLEQAFKKHAHTMRQYAAAIRLQEQKFDAHEHEIVQYEKGGNGDELVEMARQHGAEAGHHADHRTAHGQLKRRHHNIIAHWNALLEALGEAKEETAPTEQPAIVVPS